MTLEQIKDEVAREHGYDDWRSKIYENGEYMMDMLWEKVCKRYATACVKASQGWVEVKERLPEASGFYAVMVECDDDKQTHGFWFDKSINSWRFDNDMAPGEALYTAGWYVEVTHWKKIIKKDNIVLL